jgi:hypothetical protein
VDVSSGSMIPIIVPIRKHGSTSGPTLHPFFRPLLHPPE